MKAIYTRNNEEVTIIDHDGDKFVSYKDSSGQIRFDKWCYFDGLDYQDERIPENTNFWNRKYESN